MIEATTKNGLTVWLAFVPDCEYNTGGWYVEVYLDEFGDRYDDFCIHTDDCDCSDDDAIIQYARDYIADIEYRI